jgi:N-acyl homoserine lactone hydrolase
MMSARSTSGSTANRLWPLSGASTTLDLGYVVLGQSGSVTHPVPAFLVEHERGLVLFDTGVAPEAWDDPRAVYPEISDHLRLVCPPENRLDLQIRKCGFGLDDVTHVIVSHSHFDHTGGLYLFPQAEMYMSEEDLRYAFWPDSAYLGWFRPEDLDRTRSFRWNLVSSDIDLFGDGSIQILRTPGHTQGELSVLVKLPSRSFVLTGDTVHHRSSMQAGLPCPCDMDGLAAIRSIRRIKQVSASHQAEVWVMHDPADWEALGGKERGYA